MISYGKAEYIPDLKLMWNKVFGDTESYLDAFFNQVYKDENTLVYLEDGIIVSALYMVPYTFMQNSIEYEIVYLYALATEPAYRGRKIMSQLIEKSLDISRGRDYALSVLIPAQNSLFGYYRQFGFEEGFSQVKITKSLIEIESYLESQLIHQQEISHGEITLHVAEANQVWDIYLKSIKSSFEGILLSKEQNDFYVEELLKEGGEVLVFQMNGNPDGYALLQLVKDEDDLRIYETNVDAKSLTEFYKAMIKRYSFKTITFYQPVCFGEKETNANRKSFAMVKNLKGLHLKSPFINRVLM